MKISGQDCMNFDTVDKQDIVNKDDFNTFQATTSLKSWQSLKWPCLHNFTHCKSFITNCSSNCKTSVLELIAIWIPRFRFGNNQSSLNWKNTLTKDFSTCIHQAGNTSSFLCRKSESWTALEIIIVCRAKALRTMLAVSNQLGYWKKSPGPGPLKLWVSRAHVSPCGTADRCVCVTKLFSVSIWTVCNWNTELRTVLC